MSTGQTLLTIGAFILLSNILVTFYRLLAESGQTIDSSQGGITAVSLATSYMQVAQGLHFDERTINSFIPRNQVNRLTHPDSLRTEGNYGVDTVMSPPLPPEDHIGRFDDVDDFNGYEFRDTTMEGTLGYYRAKFTVNYVSPNRIDSIVNIRTFVKRLDIKVWREFPPSEDTVRTSTIIGYWMFSNAF